MDYNLFKGLVTHIIDPNNFWMRIGTDCDMHLFSEYQQRLNAFYNLDLTKYTCCMDQMYPGYLVVVAEATRDDGCHWERAQVTRVDSDNKTVDVLFVDLGYTDIVEVDRCHAITPDLFNFLPPQASRVSLGSVKPLSNTWTTRATGLLHKETYGQEVLTLLLNYDEASICYTVILYARQMDGTWRSLVHIMQEEELAVGTNESVEEILTNDDVKQCLYKMEERQKGESEPSGAVEKETLQVKEEEEVEKWEDSHVAGGSEDFIATLMNGSQVVQHSSTSSSDKQRVVTGYDYRTLMRTRTISLSQMQLEKGVETQTATKTSIARDLNRLESSHSQTDEQDWDAVEDTDFHVDIKSQIYHGVPDRQHSNSSDDGINALINGTINVDKLKTSPKKSALSGVQDVEVPTNVSYHPSTEDFGRLYYFPKEENEDSSDQADKINSDSGFDAIGGDGGLGEIKRHLLEKQIKEILLNPDGLDADFVCASIYGVVEPDLHAPRDLLCAVISAILEYIVENSYQHSGIAFAILDTYSDAIAFGTAVVEVIHKLKDQFVKKYQSKCLSNRHRDFAVVLALVFKQAEDWEEGVCKTVQDLAVALAERWVIFNKQRHLSGDELVECELLYLETAKTFFMECYDLLKVKYSPNLNEVMKDIREKLLQDKTRRSVRTYLLDMLLTFNPSGRLGKGVACSVGTQTECSFQGRESNDSVPARDIGDGGDSVPPDPIASQSLDRRRIHHPPPTSTQSDPDLTLFHLNDLPTKVRRLPPRLVKKYLQDHAIADSQPPSVSMDDMTVQTHQLCDKPPDFDTNTSSPTTLPNQFSSLSLYDDVASVQNISDDANDFNKSCSPGKMNDYMNKKLVFQKGSLSPETVMANAAPALQPGDMKESLSSQNVECEIDSPQSVLHDGKLEADSIAKNTQTSFLVEQNEHDVITEVVENTQELNAESLPPEIDNVVSEAVTKISEEWVKSKVKIERDNIIRYTPQQLRDLNAFAGQPAIPLWELWEPKDVLEKMVILKNPGKSALDEDTIKSGSQSNLGQEDFNWRSSCYSLKRNKKELGSSVDPDSPSLSNQSHSGAEDSRKLSDGTLQENNGEVYFKKVSGLQGIASGLFNCKDFKPEISPALEEGEDWSGEAWHEDDRGRVGGLELEELLKPKKKVPGKKAKKRKGREIPFDQYLQEQEAMKSVSEDVEAGVDDGHGQDEIDLTSPEALKMYEDLEQQGVGLDSENEIKSRVFLPSKIGCHASSSSKRPSLFSSIRPEQPLAPTASKPWAPTRQRFCTRCGSRDHVVYDCNEKSSRLLQ